jgi:predicted CXXCH cytochrome family protein
MKGIGYRPQVTGNMIQRGNCWLSVIVAILVFPGWLVPYNGSQQKETRPNAENVAPQDDEYLKVGPSYYVGPETCKGCHEDVGPGFERGPHRKSTLRQSQGPQWQGCEACHGPGKEHAESGDPGKIIRLPGLSREESSRRCLGCHQFSPEHANFLRSRHLKNNVGCTDCHSIHHPAADRKLLKAAQPNLCFGCHAEIKLGTSKPFHQPGNQASANCANCHNPHNLGIVAF